MQGLRSLAAYGVAAATMTDAAHLKFRRSWPTSLSACRTAADFPDSQHPHLNFKCGIADSQTVCQAKRAT